MSSSGILSKFKHKVHKDPCKGQVFKAQVRRFQRTSQSFVICQQVSLILQKRLSCPGCEHCGWTEDTLLECMYCDTPMNFDELVDGKYYRTTFTNVSTDWETGYVDDFDIAFVEVNPFEEEKENDIA